MIRNDPWGPIWGCLRQCQYCLVITKNTILYGNSSVYSVPWSAGGHSGPGHSGFGHSGPGHPGPRTSRSQDIQVFRTSRSQDIQVPGHPGLLDVQVFRTSRSFGRPLIVGSIYPIQIYKIQVKYISQIVCSLSNRKLTFIPQMLA